MIKFITLLICLLLTSYFLNIKMTSIARAIAFKEYEEFTETKKCFFIMVVAVIFWSIYFSFLD